MKKVKEELKYNKKGITLISLVVTIVVLIILAGVSIVILTGDNGILKKATQAKQRTDEASYEESIMLSQIEASTYIDNYEYTDTRGNTITIPSNCVVSQSKGENIIDAGLVIIDKNGNEWVWINIPTESVFKDLTFDFPSTEAEYNLIEQALVNYANVYKKGSASQNRNFKDSWYPETGMTESEYTTIYNTMLKSVYENGGFWISRYEAGIEGSIKNKELARTSHSDIELKAVSKKNAIPYNYITCSESQKLASKMSPTSNMTSSMLFGIQWNLVCKFLEENSDLEESDINVDSSNWGNFYNTNLVISNSLVKQSTDKGNTWKSMTGNKLSNNEVILSTGASINASKLNIYDFAGNLWEFTLEYSTNELTPCVRRGACFDQGASNKSASHSIQLIPETNNYGITFRASLY